MTSTDNVNFHTQDEVYVLKGENNAMRLEICALRNGNNKKNYDLFQRFIEFMWFLELSRAKEDSETITAQKIELFTVNADLTALRSLLEQYETFIIG